MKTKPSNVFAAIGISLLFFLLLIIFYTVILMIIIFVISLFAKTDAANGLAKILYIISHGEFDISWYLILATAIGSFFLSYLCLSKLIGKDETTGRIAAKIIGITLISVNVIFGIINLLSGNSILPNLAFIICGITGLTSK